MLEKENEYQIFKLVQSEGRFKRQKGKIDAQKKDLEDLEVALKNIMKWKILWKKLCFLVISVLMYKLIM